MSTVTYRDGVLAADTLASGGVLTIARKVHRIRPSLIVGFVGNYQDGLAFVKWCSSGMDTDNTPKFLTYGRNDDAPSFSAIVIHPDLVTLWSEHFQPEPVYEPFIAMGSGRDAARAAMVMGATAEEAIRVAMQVDLHTSGDVDVLRLVEAKLRAV